MSKEGRARAEVGVPSHQARARKPPAWPEAPHAGEVCSMRMQGVERRER